MSDDPEHITEMTPEERLKRSREVKKDLEVWANAAVVPWGWKVGLLAVAFGFICSAVMLWLTATTETLARMQTFNGALTIPVGALVWAFAFTFIFLVPTKAMQILVARVMLYTVELSDKSYDVMENAAKEIEGRGERIEAKVEDLHERARKALDGVNDAEHPVLDRLEKVFSDGIERLREEIRSAGNSGRELNDALSAGEKEAERLLRDRTTSPETPGGSGGGDGSL